MNTQVSKNNLGLNSPTIIGLYRTVTVKLFVCVGTRLSAAVHETLLPIMKEIKNDLNSVKNDLSSFNETVKNLSLNLEDCRQQTASQLSSLNQQLTQLFTVVDTLDSKLDSVNNSSMLIMQDLCSLNETMNRISDDVEDHDNHTIELMNLNECLQLNTTIPTQQTNMSLYTCGGTGGWRRVVYLDMTDNNTNCPSGWQLTATPREHVVKLVLVSSPVTQSPSLSVEETTLECMGEL